MIHRFIHIVLSLLLLFIAVDCATYYDKTVATERALLSKNYESAKKRTRENNFLSKRRNSLLYNLEMGKMCHLLNEFEESNLYFNNADQLMEEYRTTFEVMAGVTVNPSLQPYLAEPHEQIMIHYYKILNYLQYGDLEDALVEVRRLDLKVQAMKVATKGTEKKYSQDAFGLLLMGMIYEADNDHNNAFIAYRNAKHVYESDETGLYSKSCPVTLEQDILRNATYSGIDFESLETLDPDYAPNGELVLFYENGLSPIKAEQNYIFFLRQNSTGYFFQSHDLIVPIDYNFASKNPNFKPSDLGMIRLSFPYYVRRTFSQDAAIVTADGYQYKMQPIEDISAISFQIERDNFFNNLGRDLLRLTIKKMSEIALSQNHEFAGSILNIANTLSEKADTRNWQSLPGQIQYVRIPLQEGTNKINVRNSEGEEYFLEVKGNGTMIFRNICEY